MKKVLFVATITPHIIGFHLPYLKWFKNQGYEVHVASNGNEQIEYCDKHIQIPFTRNPFSISNIQSYKMLKKIINKNEYEIIHCHTPVGGVLTRLAARKAQKNNKVKIIYTAHGFHFYKKAPIINWLLFYPIEKFLSKYTNSLITINNEDYLLAKRKFYTNKIYLINGIGVDENKFKIEEDDDNKVNLLQSLGLKKEDFIFISVGELNKNKNHLMQIKAMKKVVKKYKNAKLVIAGKGVLNDKYEKIIKKNNLQENIKLIGYRSDIPELLKISNCLISTSKREGLPVNVIEAMFCGLPIIATNIRGQVDLVKPEVLVKINDVDDLAKKMEMEICKGNRRIDYNLERYKLEDIIKNITKIYKEIIDI